MRRGFLDIYPDGTPPARPPYLVPHEFSSALKPSVRFRFQTRKKTLSPGSLCVAKSSSKVLGIWRRWPYLWILSRLLLVTMPDWAQKLTAVLGMTLVYALGSAVYLAFLNPKGELVQYRTRIIAYGSGFMMVFMCSVFFPTELLEVRRIWLGVFVAIMLGILIWGAAVGGRTRINTLAGVKGSGKSQTPIISTTPIPSKRPWRMWQKMGIIWLVTNLIPLWILEMFHRARLP